MHKTRSLRFALAPVLATALLSIAAGVVAQSPQWKPFGSSSDGFRALFPSDPEVAKSSVPVNGDNFELRSYVAEAGSTALYVGVCDYGAKGAAADPEQMLSSAKKGAVEHMNAHILSEKKITLAVNQGPDGHGMASRGVAFEAESDTMDFTVRMFMAGGVLYQVMVSAPLDQKFADTARFLDSFELLPHQPAAATASQEWKPYSYPSEGFSASFPAQPMIGKRNISTDAGQFELRAYVAEDSSAALIAAVCDYGATAAGKDPEILLDGAKKGAIDNLKAYMVSEKKMSLGVNPGVQFEADNATDHISARIYLAGTILYQTIVVSPINGRYPDTARFLDSFQLLDHPAK
jgi:hypothetical protein